jgi:integral membrane protein
MSAKNPSKAYRAFIMISRAEAVSYLLLLGIAMPLKYLLDMPLMVKYVGWAHGVLFMAYIVQLLYVGFNLKWNEIRFILGFIASLLPFGPFLFERLIDKEKI